MSTDNMKKGMKLVLPDGSVFEGVSCGSGSTAVGELVFNTSMVGYQEVISDPSYAGQIVVMTYPLMGQYGIVEEDFESKITGPVGLVAREICTTPSNFRSTDTLSEYLAERNISCIEGPDTRMLTRRIRSSSKLMAAIVPSDVTVEQALELIRGAAAAPSSNLVPSVSCTHRWFSRTPNHKWDVVVMDLGMKRSIVSELNRRGVNVTVVPYNTSTEDILSFDPDGLVLSSGPGDPRSVEGVREVVQAIKGRVPLCGIGLGHQLLALSYGASLTDLGCGYHGDYPIRETSTGRIFTACLNHCLAVDRTSALNAGLSVTHENVIGGVVEGLEKASDKAFSCEFTPEGCPGPQENDIFDKLIELMSDNKR